MTKWRWCIAHSLVTLTFCFVALGWLAVAFYFGREHAQAEYRYIEAHGGKRESCPWYCGFLPEAWTVKGLLDWLFPVVIATVYTLFWR